MKHCCLTAPGSILSSGYHLSGVSVSSIITSFHPPPKNVPVDGFLLHCECVRMVPSDGMESCSGGNVLSIELNPNITLQPASYIVFFWCCLLTKCEFICHQVRWCSIIQHWNSFKMTNFQNGFEKPESCI